MSEEKIVYRPLKVIALISAIISIILLIVAVASEYWLTADGYRQGLWSECYPDSTGQETCSGTEDAWLYTCAILCVIALIVDLISTVLIGIGLYSPSAKTKSRSYNIAMWLMFTALVCVLIALIIYTAISMDEINAGAKPVQPPVWYFQWAYGVAWGAAIFMCGVAILLLIDRDMDELYLESTSTKQQ